MDRGADSLCACFLQDRRAVGQIGRLCPIIVSPDCPLIDVITSFQQGRAHLAFVSEDPDTALEW